MMIEVEENPNCSESGCWRFKPLAPPMPVQQIRLYERKDEGEWCWVTGWSDREESPFCPAYAQKVEESGIGIAILVYGGNWGLRFKPVGCEEDWDLRSPHQWGSPYILISEESDLIFA